MSFKPVIGINGEFRAAKKEVVPLSWYNTGYYDSVTAAGGLPVLLPPLAEDRDLKQFLKMLDGLVLCGCPLDLDPVRLGLERHPATRSMPIRREDFDRRLCKLAYDMRTARPRDWPGHAGARTSCAAARCTSTFRKNSKSRCIIATQSNRRCGTSSRSFRERGWTRSTAQAKFA